MLTQYSQPRSQGFSLGDLARAGKSPGNEVDNIATRQYIHFFFSAESLEKLNSVEDILEFGRLTGNDSLQSQFKC